jgi:ribosome biogenesis GTPase A
MRRAVVLRNAFDPVFMRKVKRTFAMYKDSMSSNRSRGMSREAFVDIDEKGPAWYLGHMKLAATDLRDKISSADFVLEIRDARLPFTTENPNLRSLIGRKPHLVIFNKAELANEDCNHAIQRYYESIGSFALFTSARRSWKDTVETVQRFVTHILPAPQFKTTAQVGLVVGMPNVGKSTLINSLRMAHEYQFHREDFRRSRTAETVSMAPGTTRHTKLVAISKDPPVVLYDTPGQTMPGCFSAEAGLKLAACGIVPTNNVSLTDALVARYLFDIMSSAGALEHLAECLHIPRAPVSFDDCIAMICERSGTSAQTSLGNLEPIHAQRFLCQDFQFGNLGKMTLDRLPRKVKAHLQASGGHAKPLRLTHTAHDAGDAASGDEDFTVTHSVTTEDVVDRYPEHMKEVMAELQRGVEADSQVISKRRGPISRATTLSDAVRQHVRLRPGR